MDKKISNRAVSPTPLAEKAAKATITSPRDVPRLGEAFVLTTNPDQLLTMLSQLASQIHFLQQQKGFWDNELNCSFAAKIMLVVTELSEAVEAHRCSGESVQLSEKIEGFTAIEEELADTLLRLFDIIAYFAPRTFDAMLSKAMYNESRPYKHGKEY